jgi:hypothetical protein
MVEVRYTPGHSQTISVLINPDDKSVVLPSGWHMEVSPGFLEPVVDVDAQVVWVPHGWKIASGEPIKNHVEA